MTFPLLNSTRNELSKLGKKLFSPQGKGANIRFTISIVLLIGVSILATALFIAAAFLLPPSTLLIIAISIAAIVAILAIPVLIWGALFLLHRAVCKEGVDSMGWFAKIINPFKLGMSSSLSLITQDTDLKNNLDQFTLSTLLAAPIAMGTALVAYPTRAINNTINFFDKVVFEGKTFNADKTFDFKF